MATRVNGSIIRILQTGNARNGKISNAQNAQMRP